ncbi:Nucleic-acid-binding protein from transposon X-element, partial [Stegodyphus mimosarum]
MKDEVQFSTFCPKKDTLLKVVIRGLFEDSLVNDIEAELKADGFPVLRISQFTRKMKDEEIKLPVFFVSLKRSDAGRLIYRRKKLLNLRISVRRFRTNKRTLMCFRCQRYGPGQLFCNNLPRCLKCGQDHLTYICKLS